MPAIIDTSGQYVSSSLFQVKVKSSYVQPNPTTNKRS